MRKLIKNSAMCLNCWDILVSRDRHEFVKCTCGLAASKAINEYKGQKYTKKLAWTAAYRKHVNKCESGIFIDGGLEYQRYGGNINHFYDLSEYAPEKKNVREQRKGLQSKSSKETSKNKRRTKK